MVMGTVVKTHSSKERQYQRRTVCVFPIQCKISRCPNASSYNKNATDWMDDLGKKFISQSTEGQVIKDQGTGQLGALPGFQMPSCYLLQQQRDSVMDVFYKETDPIHERATHDLIILKRSPILNTITLRIEALV